MTKAEDFPPEKKVVEVCYSHDLVKLRDLADLTLVFAPDAPPKSALAVNWDTVKGWSERSRYARVAEPKARQLVEAVTDPTEGVLPWIKKHW